MMKGRFLSRLVGVVAAVYFCNYYERGAGTGTRGRNAETALDYFTAH